MGPQSDLLRKFSFHERLPLFRFSLEVTIIIDKLISNYLFNESLYSLQSASYHSLVQDHFRIVLFFFVLEMGPLYYESVYYRLKQTSCKRDCLNSTEALNIYLLCLRFHQKHFIDHYTSVAQWKCSPWSISDQQIRVALSY